MIKKFLIAAFLILNISCYSTTSSNTTEGGSSNSKQERLEDQKQMAIASVRRGNFKQALKDIGKAKDMDDSISR